MNPDDDASSGVRDISHLVPLRPVAHDPSPTGWATCDDRCGAARWGVRDRCVCGDSGRTVRSRVRWR